MPRNTVQAPPCPRVLAAMDLDELLALMEAHAEEPPADHPAPILDIAAALAQRLGIHCDSYLGLMVAATSPREWRGLVASAGIR